MIKLMTEGSWTAKDDEELRTLRATGMKWHVVAKRRGRTEAATVTRGVALTKREPVFPEVSTLPSKELRDVISRLRKETVVERICALVHRQCSPSSSILWRVSTK
jgi:hypothetical protein